MDKSQKSCSSGQPFNPGQSIDVTIGKLNRLSYDIDAGIIRNFKKDQDNPDNRVDADINFSHYDPLKRMNHKSLVCEISREVNHTSCQDNTPWAGSLALASGCARVRSPGVFFLL